MIKSWHNISHFEHFCQLTIQLCICKVHGTATAAATVHRCTYISRATKIFSHFDDDKTCDNKKKNVCLILMQLKFSHDVYIRKHSFARARTSSLALNFIANRNLHENGDTKHCVHILWRFIRSKLYEMVVLQH